MSPVWEPELKLQISDRERIRGAEYIVRQQPFVSDLLVSLATGLPRCTWRMRGGHRPRVDRRPAAGSRELNDDPGMRKIMKLPVGPGVPDQGAAGIDLIGKVFADGLPLDFACGDMRSTAAAPSCGSTWKPEAGLCVLRSRREPKGRWVSTAKFLSPLVAR